MFLKLSVARKQYADVYVEVPDGFDKSKLFRGVNASVIGEAAETTTCDFDWDFDGDDWADVEVVGVSEVSANEFGKFDNATIDVNRLQ